MDAEQFLHSLIVKILFSVCFAFTAFKVLRKEYETLRSNRHEASLSVPRGERSLITISVRVEGLDSEIRLEERGNPSIMNPSTSQTLQNDSNSQAKTGR
jgi:hypothetical protein